MPTETIGRSSRTDINGQFINGLIMGHRWVPAPGVTFAFPTAITAYGANYAITGYNELPGFQALNLAQATASRSAFTQVQKLTNLVVTEVAANT